MIWTLVVLTAVASIACRIVGYHIAAEAVGYGSAALFLLALAGGERK